MPDGGRRRERSALPASCSHLPHPGSTSAPSPWKHRWFHCPLVLPPPQTEVSVLSPPPVPRILGAQLLLTRTNSILLSVPFFIALKPVWLAPEVKSPCSILLGFVFPTGLGRHPSPAGERTSPRTFQMYSIRNPFQGNPFSSISGEKVCGIPSCRGSDPVLSPRSSGMHVAGATRTWAPTSACRG